jgi:membrane associated rhomboid family serine protease
MRRYTSNTYPGSYGFGGWRAIPPAVKWLLVANVVIYLFQLVTERLLVIRFGLIPAAVIGHFEIWRLATYMFLHGGLFHILINMFILWMFGVTIERAWGTKRFLFYYFMTGIAGGLFTVIFQPSSIVPTIGASGAIYGLLAAYAVMFPDQIMYLYFVFPMKVKYAVLLFVGLEFLGSLGSTPDGIGHLAHLGGAVVGFIYLKLDWRLRTWGRKLSPLRFIDGLRYRAKSRKLEQNRRQAEDVMKRVDDILDKINRVGLENISEEERHFLENASDLLTKKRK